MKADIRISAKGITKMLRADFRRRMVSDTGVSTDCSFGRRKAWPAEGIKFKPTLMGKTITEERKLYRFEKRQTNKRHQNLYRFEKRQTTVTGK